MTWMLTSTGQQVDLRCIALDSIRIEDIAHHLALVNRWAGATSRPYSVAEHSLLVVEILEREHGITSPSVLLAGLLHDAHEAYCGDLSTPMKAILGNAWHNEEQRIQHAVRAHFNILVASASHAAQIKAADLQALATEWRDLVGRPELMPEEMPEPLGWRANRAVAIDTAGRGMHERPWQHWRDAFLDRFNALTAARAEQVRAAATPPIWEQVAAIGREAVDDQLRQEHADRLGETLRLATAIADECARSDVESWCAFEAMGNHTWHDTHSVATLHGGETAEMVAVAMRYLRLRDSVTVHPTQPHLVRFRGARARRRPAERGWFDAKNGQAV